MSNSVGDSLERCRNAFRLILEGESGEDCDVDTEDYLVKASRYVPTSNRPIDVEMEPDPAIDAVEQLDYPERSELISALHTSIEMSEHPDEITVDGIEDVNGAETPTFKLSISTTGDEDDMSIVVSDVEKMLEGKCNFIMIKMMCDRRDGESATTVVYRVEFKDDVSESECRIGFKQKRIRPRMPKQIRQSKRCIRNNKFMNRNFRRRYFAKRKLLVGG